MIPTLPPLIGRFAAAVNRGNTGPLVSFSKDGGGGGDRIREMRMEAA